jgi:hypothetical protein
MFKVLLPNKPEIARNALILFLEFFTVCLKMFEVVVGTVFETFMAMSTYDSRAVGWHVQAILYWFAGGQSITGRIACGCQIHAFCFRIAAQCASQGLCGIVEHVSRLHTRI